MIAVLGFLAVTLSIAVIWPQVWRSCRHGRTLGLSPTTCWVAVAVNLCWLTFGLLVGDAAQIVTNATVGAGNTAVLVALLITQPHLRSKRMLLRTATGFAVLAAFAVGSLVAVLVVGVAPAAVAATLGSVAALTGAAAALPQPLSILLNRTQDLSGLSPTRWRLGAGSCASWASYGWLIDQPAVWLSAGVGLCCALVMCALLRSRRAEEPVGARILVRPAVTAVAGEFAAPQFRPAHARAVLVAA